MTKREAESPAVDGMANAAGWIMSTVPARYEPAFESRTHGRTGNHGPL